MSIITPNTLANPATQRLTAAQRERQRISSVEFEFQGSLVKARTFAPRRHPVHTLKKRGLVMELSKRSRLNLLEKLNRIDWHKQKAIFITLTYHNDVPHERSAKKQLRAFLKRLWRAYGACAVIWRLEYQPGRGAVHFHLLALGLSFVPKSEVLRHWREVTGDETIVATRIEMIDNPKKAMRYVSKYIAKSSSWHKGVVDVNTGEIAPSLVDLTIYHNWLEQSPGRFWGIEQREHMPFALLEVVMIRDGVTILHDFKRLMRRKYPKINKTRAKGARLFVGDAYQWLDALYFVVMVL